MAIYKVTLYFELTEMNYFEARTEDEALEKAKAGSSAPSGAEYTGSKIRVIKGEN